MFPTDILLQILCLLDVVDLLSVRTTNSALCALTRLRSVWLNILNTLPNIPLPYNTDPTTLDSRQLEQLVRRTLHLHATWSSIAPVPRRTSHWHALPPSTSPSSSYSIRCYALHFLPAHRALLSVTARLDLRPPTALIQCWHIPHTSPPPCRAVLSITHDDTVAVNTDPSSPAVLAVQSPVSGTSLYALDLAAGFVPLASFPHESRQLFAFSGTLLAVLRAHHDVAIWDTAHPAARRVFLKNPALTQPERCETLLIVHDYALLVRTRTFEVYSLALLRASGSSHARSLDSTSPGGDINFAVSTIHPIAQYTTQWRIDSVRAALAPAVAPAPAPAPVPHRHTYPPINILLRFGSYHPWPVNFLHHLVLDPDPDFPLLSSSPCPSSSPILTGTPVPPPSPWLLPPRTARALASPVRLHAVSPLALGAHGTAMWIDSHVDHGIDGGQGAYGYGYGVEDGQRVAGVRLVASADDSASSSAFSSSADPPPTTYASRAHDAWLQVAMDEAEGWVAMGGRGGELAVLEFV